jgi:hypothetical protein
MEKVYISGRVFKEVAVDRRQMTLNLNDKEMDLLDRLSERRGMSKTALVRQALRLYQSVTERIERGEKVFVEHPATKDKAELMVL